jgi:hypothetical protein
MGEASGGVGAAGGGMGEASGGAGGASSGMGGASDGMGEASGKGKGRSNELKHARAEAEADLRFAVWDSWGPGGASGGMARWLSAKRARLAEAEERVVRQKLDNQRLRDDLDLRKRELIASEALEAEEERNVANGTPGEPYRDRAELLDLMHAKMRELAAVEPVPVDQPAPAGELGAVDQPAPADGQPDQPAPAGELGAVDQPAPADDQPDQPAPAGELGAGEGGAGEGGAEDTASGGMGGAEDTASGGMGGADGAPAYKCYSKASTHTRTA